MFAASIQSEGVLAKTKSQSRLGTIEAGCSQEEGPKKGFVMGSRTRGVQETLEKCI